MSSAPEHYSFWVRLASRASLATAALLILTKLIAWFYSDSASLLASLTDSMMDAMASLVSFYALRVSLTPPDKQHPFGHGKAEPLATLVQAGFILGSSLLLLFYGVSRWMNPEPVSHSSLGIGVSVFAIVITLGLVMIQKKAVAETGSMAIAADSLHYRSDLLLNVAVLLALYLVGQGWLWADGVFAVLIALYIGAGAWDLGYEAIQLLLDCEAEPEVQAEIDALARQDPQVLGVHDLRTRRSGYMLQVQLHLELDGSSTLQQAHEVADAVEQRIKAAFPGSDVIVHQDPR